eukprot:123078-Prymnesium_polylepis.1
MRGRKHPPPGTLWPPLSSIGFFCSVSHHLRRLPSLLAGRPCAILPLLRCPFLCRAPSLSLCPLTPCPPAFRSAGS